jgi:4-methyl-5(b-hydroxyethyl)-thiazole monophosphate biosynthesis
MSQAPLPSSAIEPTPIRVLVVLADGVEELEAVAPIDFMRRAGFAVTLITPPGATSRRITGRNGIVLEADHLWDDEKIGAFDALVLPGGPAVHQLKSNHKLIAFIKTFGATGKPIGAICAAPLLLEEAGLLAGKQFTAHFSTANELPQAMGDQKVVTDGTLLTSAGAGTAIEFGLALVRHLGGEMTALKVAQETAYTLTDPTGS